MTMSTVTYCSHGINHAGERHGCDGCCKGKAASEHEDAFEQAVMLKRERDEARAETERYRKRYEAIAVTDITAHTKRLEEYAAENAALRDRIKGEHLAWLAKKEYEDRIAELDAALRKFAMVHIQDGDELGELARAALSPEPKDDK